MTNKPGGSTWVTVDTGGATLQVSAPEAHPEREWRMTPPAPVKVDTAMPSYHVVVASLDAAARLETADAEAEGFEWFELRVADFAHVAILRCLHEGVDPTAPVEPIVEQRNPFTGETFRPTVLHHALDTFEVMVDGTLLSGKEVGAMAADGAAFDALVIRIPPALVAWLARMSDAAKSETARAWSRASSAVAEQDPRGSRPLPDADAARALDVMVSAAKAAVAAGRELFLWFPS